MFFGNNTNTTELITNMLVFKKIGEKKGVPKKDSQKIGVISSMVKGDPFTRIFLAFQMLKKEEESIKLRAVSANLARLRDKLDVDGDEGDND